MKVTQYLIRMDAITHIAQKHSSHAEGPDKRLQNVLLALVFEGLNVQFDFLEHPFDYNSDDLHCLINRSFRST